MAGRALSPSAETSDGRWISVHEAPRIQVPALDPCPGRQSCRVRRVAGRRSRRRRGRAQVESGRSSAIAPALPSGRGPRGSLTPVDPQPQSCPRGVCGRRVRQTLQRWQCGSRWTHTARPKAPMPIVRPPCATRLTWSTRSRYADCRRLVHLDDVVCVAPGRGVDRGEVVVADPVDVGALVEEVLRGLAPAAVACAPEGVGDPLGGGSRRCGDKVLDAADLSRGAACQRFG